MAFDDETPYQDSDDEIASDGNDPAKESDQRGHRIQSIHRRYLNHIAEDETKSLIHMVPDVEIDERKKSFAAKAREIMNDNMQTRTTREWFGTIVPCYRWLSVYDWRTKLVTDVLAGLAVGVMVIPQAMSYAKLAGLPVEYGLYSALFPVWVYALFGSSRQLAIGPVALVSLLLFTGLTNQMARLGIEEDAPNYLQVYTTLAIQTSFLVGIFNLIMGILRLGFVTIFLSNAVISGFISGAAIIIGLSQVKYIFGVKSSGNVVQEILKTLFADIDNFNYKTFLMGTGSIAFLMGLKHAAKVFPKHKWLRAVGPITITVISIAITWAGNISPKSIPVVGTIPAGFPAFTGGLWTPINDLGGMLSVALSITIIGFMESVAIAKKLAAEHKYEIDASMELIGLGMANFVGAMFQAYPVTGSFSRSAVNNSAGAQSGVSGMVTATLVALVLLFLTPVFEHMPLAVLAAIVITGVINLVDYPEAIYLWKVHKFDLGVWVIAFVGTLFLGVEIGLAISVCISLLLIIYESAFPHTAVLGRLPGSTVYRNIKQYPLAERYDGIVIVRIDAPIYFANTDNIRSKLLKYEEVAEEELAGKGGGDVKFIILELSPVSYIDSSALHILQVMVGDYKARGIQIILTNPSVSVMEALVRSKVADHIGREHMFASMHDAAKWCLDRMDLIESSFNGENQSVQ